MPAALKLIPKSAHEFTLRIEDENGRMVLQILPPFVDDVEQPLGIHGDIVRGLPRVFIRELRPVVQHLVAMLAAADDERRAAFLRGEDMRHRKGSGTGGDKTTAGNVWCGFHGHGKSPRL